VLDAITLEKQGIPAVAVVTEPFADEAAVRSRADAALARIERLLLEF
jgi:cell division GTPase FtsZ